MELTGEVAASAEVLILDDEPLNVALAERILKRHGFSQIRTLTDPYAFRETFIERPPDVILLDLHMPGLDGMGILSQIEALRTRSEYLPTLVLTGDASAEARKRALSAGAIDFITKPLDETELVLRVLNYLEVRRLHMRLVVRASDLADQVRQRTTELERTQAEAFLRLNLVSEFRDDETFEHTNRVGKSAELLAAALGQTPGFVEAIKLAAPLHDIGKIAIPDAVLLKAGKLTDEEFDIMRSHCEVGGRIIGDTFTFELEMAKVIAETHHERWNGTGYPNGLVAQQIPYAGRIVIVCDVFDALIHRRPYKEAWSIDRALEEITAQRGRHFDPEIASVFVENIARHLPWVNAAGHSRTEAA